MQLRRYFLSILFLTFVFEAPSEVDTEKYVAQNRSVDDSVATHEADNGSGAALIDVGAA